LHGYLIAKLAGTRYRVANNQQRGLSQSQQIREAGPHFLTHVFSEGRMQVDWDFFPAGSVDFRYLSEGVF
jgi:hypothetical protein